VTWLRRVFALHQSYPFPLRWGETALHDHRVIIAFSKAACALSECEFRAMDRQGFEVMAVTELIGWR
jgi:hypothetical protein